MSQELKQGKYTLVMFSESRIALNREIANHPELIERLQNQPPNEFEMRLAEIAAFLGIVLDDTYYPQDLDMLCDIMVRKLKERSCLIILPDSYSPTAH